MNKYLLIAAALLAVSGTASSNGWWTKISEQRLPSGDVICQWKSGWGTSAQYTTTAGSGYCPRPA